MSNICANSVLSIYLDARSWELGANTKARLRWQRPTKSCVYLVRPDSLLKGLARKPSSEVFNCSLIKLSVDSTVSTSKILGAFNWWLFQHNSTNSAFLLPEIWIPRAFRYCLSQGIGSLRKQPPHIGRLSNYSLGGFESRPMWGGCFRRLRNWLFLKNFLCDRLLLSHAVIYASLSR